MTPLKEKKKEKTFKDKFDILVKLFLVENKDRIWNKTDFSREYFAAKKLITQYPDFDFFNYPGEFHNKFNSLLGLIGKENKLKLEKLYKEYKYNKEYKEPIEIKLEEKPVILIEKIQIKPKTILEFLDS